MLRRLARLFKRTCPKGPEPTFDPTFYKSIYPDLAGMDAAASTFDPDYYLSRYGDVARSGVDPYVHWLRSGQSEGRSGSWPLDGRSDPLRLRALIAAHGLFDQEYYVSTYREEIPEGCDDPLSHYIAVGQHKGCKPSAAFDPLLYLVRHPEARGVGALLHYLERLVRGDAIGLDLATTTMFPAVRPDGSMNTAGPTQAMIDRDMRDNLERSELFGQEQVLEITIDGQDYRLIAPSADDFFNRLRDDRPYAFSRLPHRFWDCLSELSRVRALVAEEVARVAPGTEFTADELDRLAERACDGVRPEMGVFKENFLRELLGEIVRDKASPGHLRSVSFKWQPSVEKRVFGRTDTMGPMELEQLRFFAALFKPDRPVFEAMVWKRWVFSGDVLRLQDEARLRPVVLVGAFRMRELGVRWHLPWFSHLEIPLLSYDQRHKILDRCKAAVREAKAQAEAFGSKRPLIMLQGGSFACWLIARLYQWDPSVFYLDFGQSLHIWFLDNPDVWAPWLLFHPRLVMENCHLDEFYRDHNLQVDPPFSLPQA